MTVQSNLPKSTVGEVVARIVTNRRITRSDQAQFMAMLLAKGALTSAEQEEVNRIFDGLRSGRIRVVD